MDEKRYLYVVPEVYHCDNHKPGEVFEVRILPGQADPDGWFYVENVIDGDQFPVQMHELQKEDVHEHGWGGPWCPGCRTLVKGERPGEGYNDAEAMSHYREDGVYTCPDCGLQSAVDGQFMDPPIPSLLYGPRSVVQRSRGKHRKDNAYA